MDLQTVIKQAHQEWKENPQKAKEEQEVISRYGKMFNPKNIDNLTEKDFQSFLNYKNNKHWKSLERVGPEITRDMEKFKRTLKLLLDESLSIDERIKRIRDKKSSEYHKGFGSAYYTPVLLVVYPDKYPVINKIVKFALEKIKLYPDYNSKPEWIAYKEIIPKILELAEKHQISLWQMDWVWWHVYSTLDYEGLYNFITKIMDAKSTYQPIMIRTLLEKGTASKETIDEIIRLENPEKDRKFVSNEVYEVLIDKHKIVKLDENGYKLNLLQPLTPIEQDKLVKLCNQEIIRIREKQSRQISKEVIEDTISKLYNELGSIPQKYEKEPDAYFFTINNEILIHIDYSSTGWHGIWTTSKFEKYKEEYKDKFFIIFVLKSSDTIFVIPSLEISKIFKDSPPTHKGDWQATIKRKGNGYFIKPIKTKSEEITEYLNNFGLIRIQQGVNQVDLESINDVNKWSLLKANDINDIIEKVLTIGNKRLEINENIIKRIISHLALSKHVILVGPPGTGKTELAIRLLTELGNKKLNGNVDPQPVIAVASYEWGRYEVIGGNSLQKDDKSNLDIFHLGCVTKAIKEKKFLLIDEFNRADMNKAFGEMFLAIDHDKIELREDEKPSEIKLENSTIHIPSYFRMIGTMNDYDKSLLNELSYGLLRRFAFVEINVPDSEKKVKNIVLERTSEKLKRLNLYLISVTNENKETLISVTNENKETLISNTDVKQFNQYIDSFIEFMMKLKEREIGLASYIDVVSYLIYSITIMKNDLRSALNYSLIDYILPQFDRLDIKTLKSAYDLASTIIFKNEDPKIIDSMKPSFLKNLNDKMKRLEDLDKLFKFEEIV